MMMSIIIIINHGLDLIYFGLLVVANQFISVEVYWLILDIGTELSKTKNYKPKFSHRIHIPENNYLESL